MAKELPKSETEEQLSIRKEIRKAWGSMEPRFNVMPFGVKKQFEILNKGDIKFSIILRK